MVIPRGWVGAGIGFLAVILAIVFFALRWVQKKKSSRLLPQDAEEDISIPELDASGTHPSLFHLWDARCKILCLFFFSFVVVSLRHWPALLLSLGIALSSVAIARTPRRSALKRLAAMSGFLLMLLVILPLTVPFHECDRRVVIEGFSAVAVNPRGLELAARICTKAVTVALIMEPMLRTAPFSVTMAAVQKLGVPLVLCQMLLLMYRYVFVFRHEMHRMWIGMTVRGFRGRSGWDTLGYLGCFVGMLFVRSMERTQRVYEAMLCRGYTGVFPSTVKFSLSPRDWSYVAVWVLFSSTMVAIDRWSGPLGRLFAF